VEQAEAAAGKADAKPEGRPVRAAAKAAKRPVAPQSTAIAILAALGSPAPEPVKVPEPPRLSAEEVAGLLTPSPRPKRPGGAAPAPPELPKGAAVEAQAPEAATKAAKAPRKAKAPAGAEAPAAKPARAAKAKGAEAPDSAVTGAAKAPARAGARAAKSGTKPGA
jgi:hypothetical protein